MSCVGKSTKWSTKTQTKDSTTTTTVTVEETYKYSDGRSEIKTRKKTWEGNPPSQGEIKEFVDSGDVNEDAFRNLSLTSTKVSPPKHEDHVQKPETAEPNQTPNEYAKEALETHNKLRAQHGVPPIERIAPALCKLAEEWANHLLNSGKTGHRPREQRQNIGENIAYMSGSSSNLDYPAKDATESWYSEIKDYRSYYGKEPPAFGTVPAYGHFTQVVWKGTTEMGIGKARGNGKVIVVANYRPAGNFIGKYKDNVLPPK